MNLKHHFILPSIHFIFLATIMLILGIWLPFAKNNMLPVAVAALIIILTTLIQKKKLTQCILLICTFFLGTTLSSLQKYNHQKTQKKICTNPCKVIGTIAEIEKSKQPFLDCIITINAKTIGQQKKTKLTWEPINCSIKIYTTSTHKLLIGDKIETTFLQFKKPKDESFNMFLIKSGVIATSFCQTFTYKRLFRPTWHFRRWISEKKKNIYKKLRKKISKQTFPLFASIFLGNRSEKNYFLERSKEKFKSWGILHFLARSGLHLVIFIFLCAMLLSFFPFSFKYKQLILMGLGLFYCLLSWTSISFIRAMVIFLFYKAAPLLNKQINPIHLLAIACFVILAWNPAQLFFLDFQLSFSLTLALAWFNQIKFQKKLLQNCCL